MTAPDLLKVFMLAGILLALCGIRWLNKVNAELDEENRLETVRMGCGEEAF